MATYTPHNSGVFDAAYAGAMADMFEGVWLVVAEAAT